MSTICAISTAPGTGGIAVIRVSGAQAFAICDKIFKAKTEGKTLSTQKAYTLLYGTIRQENEDIDEVMAAKPSLRLAARWPSPANSLSAPF